MNSWAMCQKFKLGFNKSYLQELPWLVNVQTIVQNSVLIKPFYSCSISEVYTKYSTEVVYWTSNMLSRKIVWRRVWKSCDVTSVSPKKNYLRNSTAKVMLGEK